MMSVYETLKQDIPILEKQFGSDSRFVQQLKQQLADIEARRKARGAKEANPATEEYYAMIVPNPKD